MAHTFTTERVARVALALCNADRNAQGRRPLRWTDLTADEQEHYSRLAEVAIREISAVK